jgi:uncharacterized protein YndB with AHSA1/START domain
MRIRESIVVRGASVEQVWTLIDDVTSWPGWNPKVQQITAASPGASRVGYTFRSVLKMGSRTKEMSGLVESRDPPSRLVVRYTAPETRGHSTCESYELAARGAESVRVTHVVAFTDAGIPLWARAVMKIITTIGKPVGRGPLEGLKQVIDDQGARSARVSKT